MAEYFKGRIHLQITKAEPEGKIVVDYTNKKGKLIPNCPTSPSTWRYTDKSLVEGEGTEVNVYLDEKGRIADILIDGKEPDVSTGEAAAGKKQHEQKNKTTSNSISQTAGRDATRNATAPYNFIEYNKDAIVSSADEDFSSLYSGKIVCSLKTLTPLLVAGPTDRNNSSNVRDFLRLNGEDPVISGSSIKGMLRSLIEAMSFSTMLNVSKASIFWREVASNNKGAIDNGYKAQLNESKVKAGFLTKFGAEYHLQKATWKCIKQKEIGNYSPDELSYSAGKNIKGGYHCAYLIKKTSDTMIIDVQPEVMKDFFAQMENSPQQTAFWKKGIKDGDQFSKPGEELVKSKAGLPVFYIEEGGKIKTIGLCRYFRIPYDYTPYDLVKSNFEGDDFATRLFGITKDQNSLKGHVSVEPLRFKKGMYSYRKDTLDAVLSSPHPSCLAHYLVQGDKARALSNDRDNKDGNEISSLSHYLYKDRPQLRGRKMYWHRELPGVDDPNTKGNGNEKTLSKLKTIENAQGEFVIHLDRVTKQELGALFAAIKLPSGYAHRLGSGKSLGLGSVRLELKSIEVQNVKDKYRSLRNRINEFTLTEDKQNTPFAVAPFVNVFKEFVFDKVKNYFKGASCYDKLPPVEQIYNMLDFENKPKNLLTRNMQVQKDRNIVTYASHSILKDIDEVYKA